MFPAPIRSMTPAAPTQHIGLFAYCSPVSLNAAMGGSRRTHNDRLRVAQIIENPDVIVAEAEKRRCRESVSAYNSQLSIWHEDEPCPSLGVACLAGHGWLEVYCGGCRQVTSIDLAGLNVHPLTKIKTIAHDWECKRCLGNGPEARILALKSSPPETVAERFSRKWREANPE